MNNYIQAASKESVETFFGLGNKKPFLIPEYQRSYEWSTNEISALLTDLINFNDEEMEIELFNPDSKADDEYFIGTIIYFENPEKEKRREIVDGQQRIVSIFLMFRVIYDILDQDQRFGDIRNLCDTLKKILWESDPMTGKIISPNISSRAISDNENQIFNKILDTGIPEKNRRDNYSMNFRIIKKTIEELATDSDRFKSFVLRLMKQVIVLPIEATNFDATLEIFERINDRGRQLTDADIFKAKIYVALLDMKRPKFIEEWKKLEDDASEVGITMQDLFTYQMYFERALSPDDDGKRVIGLRKYFLYKSQQIHDPKLILQLRKILDLLKVMKVQGTIVGISWSRDFEIRKLLSMIWSAGNDLWIYPIVVYYLSHLDNEDFPIEFQFFCKKFLSTMLIFRAEDLSPSLIRHFVMNLNRNSIASIHPKFEFDLKIDLDSKDPMEIHENLCRTPKFLKLILQMLAYNHSEQKTLLPLRWEIEYIYPRYESRGKLINDERREIIEELGNLTLSDKRVRHMANADFLPTKKMVYKNSSIAMTRELADLEHWTRVDIYQRTRKMLDELKSIWQNWSKEYDSI